MTIDNVLIRGSALDLLKQAHPILEHTRLFILNMNDLQKEESILPFKLTELKPYTVLMQQLDTDPNIFIRSECSKKTLKHFMTLKAGQGMSRHKYEINIDKEKFDELWNDVNLYYSMNRYTNLFLGGVEIEVNTFHGNIGAGYLQIKAKFDSLKDALSFEKPEWLGQETTNHF